MSRKKAAAARLYSVCAGSEISFHVAFWSGGGAVAEGADRALVAVWGPILRGGRREEWRRSLSLSLLAHHTPLSHTDCCL